MLFVATGTDGGDYMIDTGSVMHINPSGDNTTSINFALDGAENQSIEIQYEFRKLVRRLGALDLR